MDVGPASLPVGAVVVLPLPKLKENPWLGWELPAVGDAIEGAGVTEEGCVALDAWLCGVKLKEKVGLGAVVEDEVLAAANGLALGLSGKARPCAGGSDTNLAVPEGFSSFFAAPVPNPEKMLPPGAGVGAESLAFVPKMLPLVVGAVPNGLLVGRVFVPKATSVDAP